MQKNKQTKKKKKMAAAEKVYNFATIVLSICELIAFAIVGGLLYRVHANDGWLSMDSFNFCSAELSRRVVFGIPTGFLVSIDREFRNYLLCFWLLYVHITITTVNAAIIFKF